MPTQKEQTSLDRLLAAFPGATLTLRPLSDAAEPTLEPWVWSEPLPPRRTRPPCRGKGADAPDDPEPETLAGQPCRFCGEPCDLRETGGDPDGGWSHLECWADAGHPDLGWSRLGP